MLPVPECTTALHAAGQVRGEINMMQKQALMILAPDGLVVLPLEVNVLEAPAAHAVQEKVCATPSSVQQLHLLSALMSSALMHSALSALLPHNHPCHETDKHLAGMHPQSTVTSYAAGSS
jgi:hypothetical protein